MILETLHFIDMTARQFLDETSKIERAIELEWSKLDALLEKRGWKYHSSNPGSRWMFEKKLPDGRTVLVNRADALYIERWLTNET